MAPPISHQELHYLYRGLKRHDAAGTYRQYKTRLGKALILGLEVLVAADIVTTVALETTLESILGLGLLVLIRTFLSWSLSVEIEGRWPWQAKREETVDCRHGPTSAQKRP